MNIEGSIPFGNSGWRVLLLDTAVDCCCAFWRDGRPALLFGHLGRPEDAWPSQVMAALNALLQVAELRVGFVESSGIEPFEGFGCIAGEDRRLLRGIFDDDTAVQAISMYRCEIAKDLQLPDMTAFHRFTNPLDRLRAPQPAFQFQMQGGRSHLRVSAWATEKMSTLEGFVNVLGGETESWIEVKNRLGLILRLPDSDGWTNAWRRIQLHLLATSDSPN